MVSHKLSVAPMLDWTDLSINKGRDSHEEPYRNHQYYFEYLKKVPNNEYNYR
jgi:hypothetical protein